MLIYRAGQFPGPVIEARSGDELVVHVHNSVDDSVEAGIAVHWHGLNMRGMQRPRATAMARSFLQWLTMSDGVQVPTRWTAPWGSRSVLLLHLTTSHIGFESTSLSLAPIGKLLFNGLCMVSSADVCRSRYHAHSGVQRADGLFGGLVIHKPAQAGRKSDLSTYQYETEQLLLVGDWYHRQAGAVLDWYRDPDHYMYEVCLTELEVAGDAALPIDTCP